MGFVAVAMGFGRFFEIIIVIDRRCRHIEAKQRYEHQRKAQNIEILEPVQGIQRPHQKRQHTGNLRRQLDKPQKAFYIHGDSPLSVKYARLCF
ncbi:hypothetical protein D3C81_2157530 [compost metagenome]